MTGMLDGLRKVEPAAQMSSRISVLVCDDHALVRAGVCRLLELETDIEVVGEASDASSALAAVEEHSPAVVVMDVRMPGSSGIDACRAIRSRFPATRVLMLTSFDDDDALFASIMAGASGYILKQIRGGDLVDGVRKAAAGR
jgi:two-component system, NarL family, response regulator DevR